MCVCGEGVMGMRGGVGVALVHVLALTSAVPCDAAVTPAVMQGEEAASPAEPRTARWCRRRHTAQVPVVMEEPRWRCWPIAWANAK